MNRWTLLIMIFVWFAGPSILVDLLNPHMPPDQQLTAPPGLTLWTPFREMLHAALDLQTCNA